MALTQSEADALIAMVKHFVSSTPISIPPGADNTHELIEADRKERFLFDIWRGTLRLTKLRYQTRGQKIVVFVRLDIDGAPQTNPDGAKLPGTHLHIYREGYEDKWAFPIDPARFPNLANVERSLDDFCAYCNIQNVPPIQGGFT
jgi:hypothetical protein